mmetsp:Transcript_11966/g.19945  ORF Transcript_11966/g.19945 Transcript_11966/m.19945 type:complete len:201 (-) Transcript_11966:1621-2223(-)
MIGHASDGVVIEQLLRKLELATQCTVAARTAQRQSQFKLCTTGRRFTRLDTRFAKLPSLFNIRIVVIIININIVVVVVVVCRLSFVGVTNRLCVGIRHIKHHLKQRVASLVALRLQLFHQLFERHVLMIERTQHCLFDTCQQLHKRTSRRCIGIVVATRRKLRSKHQRVDKHTDRFAKLGTTTTSNWRTDSNTFLTRINM